MKKLAFLFAIVAVFAMSAAAFAVDPATKVEIAKYTASDRHNNSDAASSPKVYFPKGTTPKLNIGLNLLLDKDGVAADLEYDAVISGIRIPGGYITENKGNTQPLPVVFRISGEHGINYADDFKMSFGVYNASGENITTIKSADATFKPTPVEIALSSGGTAVNALTVELDDDVDEDFTLTYDKTMFAGMEANLGKLKVGVLAPGSSFGTSTDVSITSADVTGPDALVEGLTIGFDSTKGQLTVEGAPVEVRKVTLALYFEKADVKTALAITDGGSSTGAILATPTSADSTEWHNPEAFIIAAFDISVQESPVQEFIDDVIAAPVNSEVSKDIAAEVVRGNHSFLFVVDSSSKVLSLNGRSADIKPLSDDIDVISMKMAFLSADKDGKLIGWKDAPEFLNVVISDDKGEDLTASFDVSPSSPIRVDNGVADISVKNSSAPNGDYTINVIAAELIAGTSVSAAAKPEPGDLLAQQKISVAKTEEPRSSSGGACDAGFGVAAAAALAALALRRHNR